LRPFLLAAIAGYGVGILSLSRVAITPTYLLPGLASVYVALPGVARDGEIPRVNRKWILRLVVAGVCTLIVLYVWVKVFAS
jgi:hypothetical protein